MKRLFLAASALVLGGAMGSANAAPIDTLSNEIIWSADTPGAAIGSDSQKALPFNPIKTAGNLKASGAAATTINFNLAGPAPGATSLIQDFQNSDVPALTTNPCPTGSACGTTTLSVLGFQHVSLFEFTFTAPTGANVTSDTLLSTHDDGVSLFLAGTEAACTSSATCPTDLFPVADANPTFAMVSTSQDLTPGATYDFWYAAANGDPEQVTTNITLNTTIPPIPEPTSLTLLGSMLVGLGWFGRRRRKTG